MHWLLIVFSLVALALLIVTFSNKPVPSWRLWFIRFMLLGMCYDNLIQGIGQWFIDASWYESANVPRFLLHVTVLPFLTLFGLSIMRGAGVKMASSTAFSGFCILFTLCALAWGFYHEVLLLELEPKSAMGVIKMGSVSSLPPVATILTNILVLPMAAAVWKVSTWKWFFLGSIFIFAVNGATGAQPWGFLAGNTAELIFVICLFLTHKNFSGEPRQAP